MNRYHIIVLLFFWPTFCYSETPAPKIVETEKVAFHTVTKSLNLLGFIKANKESHLIAQINGSIDILEKPNDSHVKKDKIIAELINEDLKRHFQLANDAEHLAHINYQRQAKLHKTNSISLGLLEESQEKWIQAQINLNKAKQDLDKTLIKAPFDGQLGPFFVTEGAMVRIGDKLVTLYDTSSFFVEFYVSSAILEHLKKDQKILFADNEGKIIEIYRALDPKTHMGLVRAKLDSCTNCIIDQAIEINLVLYQKDNVLAIPNEAIFLKNGKPHVYLVNNNEAILAQINLGLEGDIYTEIITGLKIDDHVVIRNPSRLWPNVKVKII